MLYNNVKTLCKKKNISIKQLERKIGLSNGSIGKWKYERDPNPKVKSVLAISNYFGVSVKTLMEKQIEE